MWRRLIFLEDLPGAAAAQSLSMREFAEGAKLVWEKECLFSVTKNGIWNGPCAECTKFN
jgi:hypothetical protein